MNRLKVLLKYIIWIVAFYIFSNFLIEVALNSNYNQMYRNDSLEQITIHQAEATAVNGRIKGYIENTEEIDLEGKYIKFDFYTNRGVNIGSKYIEIIELEEISSFEVYFKAQNITNYTISVVNEKEDLGDLNIEFLNSEYSALEIRYLVFVALLIL